MTNIEEGSSSHEVSNDQEISEVETKGVLPGDKALQNLLDCVVRSNDRKAKFSPIYMVPSKLRDVNPSSFTPRVVSIGPLHTKLENLKLMENKKATYPSQLLDEVGSPPGETLINCVQKVTGSIENIRSYYFEMKPFTDDELIQMMILDGCFILQFIYNLSKTGNVVSNNPLRSRNIALDLVLLENQIPFFVLQDIYDLTLKKLQQKHTLTTLLSKLLELVNPFEQPLNVDPNVGTKKTHHILGLLHKVYKPNFDAPKKSIIPRAYSTVDLDEVGVKISPNKNLIWPMAIEFESSMFWGKPTLKIPVVRIDNFFEVVLRNLIAYEQYSFVHNYVRSYAMALDMLIATPENIGKLEKSGIIFNYLGSNEKASDLIRSICKNVNFQDFYYVEQWMNIVRYNKSYLAKNIKVFKQTYINTPWKVIALIAAIMVFVMTVVQFFRQQTRSYP